MQGYNPLLPESGGGGGGGLYTYFNNILERNFLDYNLYLKIKFDLNIFKIF